MQTRLLTTALTLTVFTAACGSSGTVTSTASTTAAAPVSTTAVATAAPPAPNSTVAGAASSTVVTESAAGTSRYEIQIWADNWMAVYVDGRLIGEDSVSITTERSFNAEVFSFEASTPFTVGIEAKDFKETDSGLEYIGESNQQMGDGGVIAQIVEVGSGKVVAVTDSSWRAFVTQRAPLNKDCEKSTNPDTDCQFEAFDTPADWAASGFDDSAWSAATVWGSEDVSPKGGYDDIEWDPTAEFVWGSDIDADNTVLLRSTVTA